MEELREPSDEGLGGDVARDEHVALRGRVVFHAEVRALLVEHLVELREADRDEDEGDAEGGEDDDAGDVVGRGDVAEADGADGDDDEVDAVVEAGGG